MQWDLMTADWQSPFLGLGISGVLLDNERARDKSGKPCCLALLPRRRPAFMTGPSHLHYLRHGARSRTGQFCPQTHGSCSCLTRHL